MVTEQVSQVKQSEQVEEKAMGPDGTLQFERTGCH